MKNEGQTTATASNPWWNGAYVIATEINKENPQDATALFFKVIGSGDGFLFGVIALNESRTLENQPVVPFMMESLKFNTGNTGGNLLFSSFEAAESYAAENGIEAYTLATIAPEKAARDKAAQEATTAPAPKKGPKKAPPAKKTAPTYRTQKQAA